MIKDLFLDEGFAHIILVRIEVMKDSHVYTIAILSYQYCNRDPNINNPFRATAICLSVQKFNGEIFGMV